MRTMAADAMGKEDSHEEDGDFHKEKLGLVHDDHKEQARPQ